MKVPSVKKSKGKKITFLLFPPHVYRNNMSQNKMINIRNLKKSFK